MTEKCRRRMNEREEYITTKITLKEGKLRKKRGTLGMREGMEIPVLRRGNPSPWDAGPSNPLCFSPPKQAVISSEPNIWTHSPQIHCKGLGPKTATL